jgi:uncharacterized protein YciI
MNNEVLRRKLFRTVLADSRSPAGILASSPEMVETVQRRNLGGLNAVTGGPGSQTVSNYFNTQRGLPLQGIASTPVGARGSGSFLPDRKREFLSQIAGLPAALRAKAIKDAGLADVLSVDGIFPNKKNPAIVNKQTRRIQKDPSFSIPADDSIPSKGLPSRTSYTQPGDNEMADEFAGFPSEAEKLMALGDEFGNLDPDTGMPIPTAESFKDGTYDEVPKTVAEEVSEKAITPVSINTAKAIVPNLVSGSVTPDETKTNKAVETPTLKPTDPDKISKGLTSGKESDFTVLSAKPKLTPQDLMNVDGSMLVGQTDSEKAEQANEALENTGTLKQQVKERMALQREILGDEADLRNDANYAAMVFGLALASGTSGDFKTDLANAGKELVKMKGEQNVEKRKENKALALNAMNSVLDANEKETERQATRENLLTQLSSAEKRAILASGTQLEIAQLGISQKDRALQANIDSREWLAQYNASNQFILTGAQMDHDSRLAAFSAHQALQRAQLGAEVQISIANSTQENLNNRLEAQLTTQIQLAGEDSAEVQRLKFLRDNPEMQDMLIDIAKRSKSDGLSFDEQLSLKLAGNNTLAFMPGGAAGLASTLRSLASGETPPPNAVVTGAGSYRVEDLKKVNPTVDLSEGKEFPLNGITYVVQGNMLVPKGN